VGRANDVDAADVARALGALVDDDVVFGAAAIMDHADDAADDAALVDGVVDSVRRATLSGRALARSLLLQLGCPKGPIPRGPGGAPVFPDGVVGSIAHDDAFAVCVVARGGAGMGVDVEPAIALPDDIIHDVVGVDVDVIGGVAGRDAVLARAVFCAKEAVYKATWPREGVFLEFNDVRISGGAPTGPRWRWHCTTITGTRLVVQVCRVPRIIAWARVIP
jgi:4'-phosphopantetheinyl transferase EntD